MKHYSFRESWLVPAPPEAVHKVLEDVEFYPEWWPQIVAAVRLREGEGLVACRSSLPYTLHLHLTERHRTPERLETSVDGDLQGWVRWLLTPHPDGTDLRFEQDVVVASAALAAASYVGRPVLRWNHHQMMRGCRDGLLARLATPSR